MADEIKRDTVDYRDPTPFDNSKLQSLSEISKAMRHKTYGEDTREAMAQQGEALAKLMQETGGNQSAEVVAARGNFELLGIREDAQDNVIAETRTSLAHKVDKGTNAQITWSMLAQDARDQIAQNKTAVVGPNSVANLNLTNKAVTASKTTFMSIGKNLFNKDSPDIVFGKFANYANGVVGDNADYFMSGFFEKVDDGDLTINTAGKAVHLCFYDSNLNFLSGIYKPETFKYPSNATFMRFSANIDLIDLIQLEIGSNGTEYEDYIEVFNEAAKRDLINDGKLIVGNLGVNKFNNSAAKHGYFPYYKSGNLQPNPDYFTSEFIPVEPNTYYYLLAEASGIHLCYYDKDRKFIVGKTSADAKGANMTPVGCSYVRFGAPISAIDTVMFYEGDQPREFEPYGLMLDEKNLLPKTNDRLKELESHVFKDFEVLLPTTIYVAANEQVSLYYYNILKNALTIEKGSYSVRFQKKTDAGYEKFGTGLDYMYYFETDKDIVLTVKIFDDSKNRELYTKDISVKVKSANAEVTNVFWVGDSYSDGFGLVQNTADLLAKKGQQVSFLGTRQAQGETVHHDATGGARINNFFNPKIGEETNPFYNPDSKNFDFKYYMNNNFTDKKANVFVIALGINDITRYATDDTINDSMDLIRKVIDSVHAYDPSVRILIRLINPQAQARVRWENSYESNFMRVGRMKYMQEHWNAAILNTFDNKLKNVTVMHDGSALDTRFGINTEVLNPVKFMPDYAETVTKDTHPNDVGSKQLADVIGGYLFV